MKRYTVVVLGAGPRGRAHLDAFIENRDRFDLVAACDQDAGRMQRALEERSVSIPVYTDADEMLDAFSPNVFCFATQPDARLDLARTGIRHGVRAIAYEKPMALSTVEADAIYRECEEAGVKQIVCHQHKYGAHWRKAKEIIESGALGEIETIHATSKGWFFYFITHLVDYAMWLVDYPEVSWTTGSMCGRSMLLDSHPSPDYVEGRVVFAGGIRAMFECGPLAPTRGVTDRFWYDAGVTVYGTEGFVEVVVGKGWRAVTRDGITEDRSICLDETGDTVPYITELADWLDDERRVHSCNGERTYKGFLISMGMLLSGLENRTIPLPLDPSVPIVERMRMELPYDPYTAELHRKHDQ